MSLSTPKPLPGQRIADAGCGAVLGAVLVTASIGRRLIAHDSLLAAVAMALLGAACGG